MEHMENAAVNVPEAQLKEKVSTIKVKIDRIVIATNEDYEGAVELGRAIKTRKAEVTEFFKPMKEAANSIFTVCPRMRVGQHNAADPALQYFDLSGRNQVFQFMPVIRTVC